jgi:hypothetical protein
MRELELKGVNFLQELMTRRALPPVSLMSRLHSHVRMFCTRCCTTCLTPSQLFQQALQSNITTPKNMCKRFQGGVNFLQEIMTQHALAPVSLMSRLHGHACMFCTRCCTTCHTPPQLFQALQSNIATSRNMCKHFQGGVNFLPELLTQRALAPVSLTSRLHSHARMFWTRCCTTCHTPSQLFQALQSNNKT